MIIGLKIPGFDIKYVDMPLDEFKAYQNISLNDDISILTKSIDKCNNLEANFFLIKDNKITNILFGTCVFYKNESLSEDDKLLINEYLKHSYLTDREKAMAGLYDYVVDDNVYKIKD